MKDYIVTLSMWSDQSQIVLDALRLYNSVLSNEFDVLKEVITTRIVLQSTNEQVTAIIDNINKLKELIIVNQQLQTDANKAKELANFIETERGKEHEEIER